MYIYILYMYTYNVYIYILHYVYIFIHFIIIHYIYVCIYALYIIYIGHITNLQKLIDIERNSGHGLAIARILLHNPHMHRLL